jgi:CRP-like cAMP-binding protein
MDNEIIKKYINSIHLIPNEHWDIILSNFEQFTLKRKTIYIKEGSIINRSYFLETGFVRSYVIDDKGFEVTTEIFSAPNFVYDFSTFFNKKPAQQNFETITECKFWSMNIENINKHFHNIPEYREFGRNLLVNHYQSVEQRLLEMLKFSAEKRYELLIAKHPDIVQNVPVNIIASYLGITKTSLSRLRKKISKK